jgi:hypothetical protein
MCRRNSGKLDLFSKDYPPPHKQAKGATAGCVSGQDVICLRRNSGDQMVKCSECEVSRLKPTPRWNVPAAQRQRNDAAPIGGGDRRVAEHGELRTYGL